MTSQETQGQELQSFFHEVLKMKFLNQQLRFYRFDGVCSLFFFHDWLTFHRMGFNQIIFETIATPKGNLPNYLQLLVVSMKELSRNLQCKEYQTRQWSRFQDYLHHDLAMLIRKKKKHVTTLTLSLICPATLQGYFFSEICLRVPFLSITITGALDLTLYITVAA